MVGDDEALEARHVGVWTFPCQEERMRPDVTQLEAAAAADEYCPMLATPPSHFHEEKKRE